MTNLTLLAYDYANELINSLEYHKLLKVNKEIKKTMQEEIKKYISRKEEYEDILTYGSYHPDFKEKAKEFADAKAKLFQMPLIKKQNELYQNLEIEINSFVKEIANLISEYIPVLNEIGFIERKGGISCVSK